MRWLLYHHLTAFDHRSSVTDGRVTDGNIPAFTFRNLWNDGSL